MRGNGISLDLFSGKGGIGGFRLSGTIVVRAPMSSMGSSVTSGLGDGGRGSKHLPLAIVICAVQDLGYSLQLKMYRHLR